MGLDVSKFVLRSVFTLLKKISPNICSKSRLKSANNPLPVDVGRSKTVAKVFLRDARQPEVRIFPF